jgi:hypothetical protein
LVRIHRLSSRAWSERVGFIPTISIISVVITFLHIKPVMRQERNLIVIAISRPSLLQRPTGCRLPIVNHIVVNVPYQKASFARHDRIHIFLLTILDQEVLAVWKADIYAIDITRQLIPQTVRATRGDSCWFDPSKFLTTPWTCGSRIFQRAIRTPHHSCDRKMYKAF